MHSEVLNESESFEARELAALVASKVYYHIGSFKSAMIYALSAGKLFNIEEDSEFVRTLTCTLPPHAVALQICRLQCGNAPISPSSTRYARSQVHR